MSYATVSRRRLFSAAHLYAQPRFSVEENQATFGRCYTQHGHGHNYVVQASIEGPVDPQTSLVMDLKDLDRILLTATDELDHHHLNFDVDHFKTHIPTTEEIALYLREKIIAALQALSPALQLKALRLYETDDLWVELHA